MSRQDADTRFLFFERRRRWGLTWPGRLAGLVLFILVSAGVFYGIHPFLAITHPVEAGVLVIEGWMPRNAIRSCGELAREQGYKRVITVGGPVSGVSSPAAIDNTYAYIAAKVLGEMGIKAEMVPTAVVERDRTFHSAATLRQWFEKDQIPPSRLNVATLAVHARRSRLLFQKAFGNRCEIGVVAVRNQEYDPNRWWSYSEGVKEVISEGASYIYARFLFSP